MNMITKAAELIHDADAVLICAGAGMGVDSGLPDFRGVNGFWKAYPHAKEMNLKFRQMADPKYFKENPGLAWGFYGHRYNLYENTTPHAGFSILQRWIEKYSKQSFIFTSNVDGQFQKSGFHENEINECHGSIHHLQCSESCTKDIWAAKGLNVEVDIETITAVSGIPTCPNCGATARPNILMFNDRHWISDRADEQENVYRDWVTEMKKNKLVILEIGAGAAIPTVINESRSHQRPIIRINPVDLIKKVRNGAVLKTGALDALNLINIELINS